MATRYRYNTKNRKVAINAGRSRLMTQVMKHRKGKKRSSVDIQAAARALRATLRRGVTKTGRRIVRKKSVVKR